MNNLYILNLLFLFIAMKYKITLVFIVILYLSFCQNIDCKYYMYLEAYEKYEKNKNFENLKNLLIKSLEVSKIKLEIINRSTEKIDKILEDIKKIKDMDELKNKIEVIKLKIENVNKLYLLYLIKKDKDLLDYIKIAGKNIEKVDFKTLKFYYFKYIKIKRKENVNIKDTIYSKVYKIYTSGNITKLKNILNNITNKKLKQDLIKYIEKQENCNAPICDKKLYNIIKKELFILICKEYNGTFEEYVENNEIYYGCKLNKKPNGFWVNISKNIFRPMDCKINESEYDKIIKNLNISF